MDGRHRPHHDAADVDRLADGHLADVREPGAPHPRTGAGRHEHRRVAPEIAQRRHVEVVPVQVRDEHRVHAAEAIARRDGLDAAERTDPRPGDRVGQQADPVEVDDDGRVADEVEAQAPGHRQVLRAASG